MRNSPEVHNIWVDFLLYTTGAVITYKVQALLTNVA